MKFLRPTALAAALALAFGTAPAFAESNAELANELKALKARIAELEGKLNAVPAPPADGSTPQWGMTPEQAADFNRLVVKTEGMEDANETLGFKNLKISGFIDPTYIYNVRDRRAGFQFLNGITADNGYSYDNGYFGTAMLDFQKELEGGTKWRLTLTPQRGAGSIAEAGSGNFVHEATVSIPMGDLQTRLLVGQMPDWSGYEQVFSHQNKLVTRGLLLDFTEPTSYTAVGMEIVRGEWDIKGAIGNMNASKEPSGHLSPVLAYRVDYSKGEFAGWGFAGVEGKIPNANDGVLGGTKPMSWLDLFEADTYFIRGDLTLQGQVGFGHQKKGAIVPDADGNAQDLRWFALSGLAAYKFTPRFEGVVRADWIKDDKNGGGLLGYSGYFDGAGTAGDYHNGIGASSSCVPGDTTTSCKGANRGAVSFGVNYLLTRNTTIKAEYRYDFASQPVFYDVKSGDNKKNNHLLGAQLVTSF